MTNFLTGFSGIPSYSQNSLPNTSAPNRSDKTTPAGKLSPYGELPISNGNNADNGSRNGKVNKDADEKRRFDSFECQTCKNRKYQDGSDDMGVSFQNPTKVNPRAAAAAVRGHEQEHVTRNRAKAQREGKEIVSQSVTIHTGICPECGKIYVSGGTTRTSTRSTSEDKNSEKFKVGLSDPENENGSLLNAVA